MNTNKIHENIIVKINKYYTVKKGRIDLFTAKINNLTNTYEKFNYLQSFNQGQGFGFIYLPSNYIIIAKKINNSSIIHEELNKDDLYLINQTNKDISEFLKPEYYYETTIENFIFEELYDKQKEIIEKYIIKIEKIEQENLKNNRKTKKLDEMISIKSKELLESLVEDKKNKTEKYLKKDSKNSLVDSINIICDILNIKITEVDDINLKNQNKILDDMSKISGFKYRNFELEENWWNKDLGIFLGLNENNEYIVLISKENNTYECINTTKKIKYIVTKNNQHTIQRKGYYIYKSFENKEIKYSDIFKHSLSNLKLKNILNILIFGFISGILSAFIPVLMGYAIENQIVSRQVEQLFVIVVLIFSLGITGLLFNIIKSILTSKIEFKMDIKAQIALWDRLIKLPPSFFRKYTSGEIGKKVLSFYHIRMLLSNMISETFLTVIFSVFFLIVLFLYSTKLALVAILLTSINIFITILVAYFQFKIGYKKLMISDKLSGKILEIILSVSKIRLSGSENRAFEKTIEKYVDLKNKEILEKKIQIFNNIFIKIMGIVSSIIIFYLTFKSENLTTGSFIAFNSAFVSFQMLIVGLSESTLILSYVYSLLKNITPILKEIPETDEKKPSAGLIKGSIEFNHVFFKYETNANMVINDISFKINEGDYIGIVGASGSGKSTLLRLILGFEKINSGKIYIGQKDLDTIDIGSIRSQMGVVLQNSQLFSGNIFTNISGNNYDISEEEVWKACEQSGIKSDVESFPMGLNTYIADNSSTISGGQKQRILIARALVKKPKILLFDEATSALDNITQKIVTNTLKSLNCTRVVIAHRLSTVKECDKIIVLEKGNIIEMGSYNELIAKKGYFFDLVSRQLIGKVSNENL